MDQLRPQLLIAMEKHFHSATEMRRRKRDSLVIRIRRSMVATWGTSSGERLGGSDELRPIPDSMVSCLRHDEVIESCAEEMLEPLVSAIREAAQHVLGRITRFVCSLPARQVDCTFVVESPSTREQPKSPKKVCAQADHELDEDILCFECTSRREEQSKSLVECLDLVWVFLDLVERMVDFLGLDALGMSNQSEDIAFDVEFCERYSPHSIFLHGLQQIFLDQLGVVIGHVISSFAFHDISEKNCETLTNRLHAHMDTILDECSDRIQSVASESLRLPDLVWDQFRSKTLDTTKEMFERLFPSILHRVFSSRVDIVPETLEDGLHPLPSENFTVLSFYCTLPPLPPPLFF